MGNAIKIIMQEALRKYSEMIHKNIALVKKMPKMIIVYA